MVRRLRTPSRGSAARIDVASLTKKTGSNITSALEGASPGVQVFTTSGQPGAAATVQIRGIGSVNSSTAPLYVIDGVPYTSLLSGFNMADVENLTVLKDASATALYGARAANGVVLITTKQGKAGRLSFDAEIKSGINVRYLPQYDVIDSPEEYMEVAYEANEETPTNASVSRISSPSSTTTLTLSSPTARPSPTLLRTQPTCSSSLGSSQVAKMLPVSGTTTISGRLAQVR